MQTTLPTSWAPRRAPGAEGAPGGGGTSLFAWGAAVRGTASRLVRGRPGKVEARRIVHRPPRHSNRLAGRVSGLAPTFRQTCLNVALEVRPLPLPLPGPLVVELADAGGDLQETPYRRPPSDPVGLHRLGSAPAVGALPAVRLALPGAYPFLPQTDRPGGPGVEPNSLTGRGDPAGGKGSYNTTVGADHQSPSPSTPGGPSGGPIFPR